MQPLALSLARFPTVRGGGGVSIAVGLPGSARDLISMNANCLLSAGKQEMRVCTCMRAQVYVSSRSTPVTVARRAENENKQLWKNTIDRQRG